MDRLPRSPLLMNRTDAALLVVDVQAKLVPLVLQPDHLIWNIRRLIEAASVLQIPTGVTEQYPRGLGPTVEPLSSLLPEAHEKTTFSCAECGELFDAWSESDRTKLLVAGMETHVCVQQTCLDLLANGFDVYLAVDAVSARNEIDHATALRRLESSGVTLTTVEAALFEWCDHAGTDEFKRISQLIREMPPSTA